MTSILLGTMLTLATGACSPEFENGTSDIDSWEDDATVEYTINHPCMLHTDADLNRVKSKLASNAEPWTMGYNKLRNTANISYEPRAVEVVDRGSANYVDPSPDAEAAYQLALMWNLTADTRYADAAVKILNAWAQINKKMDNGNSDAIITTGYSGYKFANAAELLRSYQGWAAEDFSAFKRWINSVIYTSCASYLTTHGGQPASESWLSWDTPAMASALAIGILLDDNDKINFVIRYFKDGAGAGCINKAIVQRHEDPAGNITGAHLAQSTETGREMGHAMTTVTMYGYICQMAKNIGEDLFSYNDKAVLDICEYLAKYNVNPREDIDMPFTPFTDREGYKREIGQNDPTQRGQICWGYELIYNHYKTIEDAQPYYSREYARTMRPEGHGIDFGTLMYTVDPVESGEDVAAPTERH